MEPTAANLIALAAELEKEGQYNGAKLLRAAATSVVNRESTRIEVPASPDRQAELLDAIAGRLAGTQAASLTDLLRAAAGAVRSGSVTTYAQTPDPFVCRICGRTQNHPFAGPCDDCGRWPTAAEQFRPIYWLRASTPHEALGLLSSAPEIISGIIEAGDPSRPGPDGGWSAHETLEHLNNAQGVFRGRIDQLLEGGDPDLASVMVWTMDAGESSTEELLDSYTRLRAEIVVLLRAAPPEAWWNAGSHEEFGRVTLAEQASYFANHEPTHLTQLAEAAGRL